MRFGGRNLTTAILALLLAVPTGVLIPAAAQSQSAPVPGWTVEVTPDKPVAKAVPGKPSVTRVQVSDDGRLTRLAFDVSSKVSVNVSTVSDPDRVIVDLPEIDFRIDAAAGKHGRGLVQAYRFGLFGPKHSRIVIDTAGPVRVEKARVEANGGRGLQLVIELARQEPGASSVSDAAAAAVLRRGQLDEPPPPSVTLRKGRPVVVIDPGHGGLDPGAVGTDGLLEKDIVLSVARRLRSLLAESGRYTVVLTRNRDIYISLDHRVRISRQHQADLFISLHADSVAEESYAAHVRGGSIYTLSDRASNEQAQRLAEKENAADILAGLESSPTDGQDEVRDILIDLLRRETADFSAHFSNLLTGELRKHIALARDPQRSAAFKVLKQTQSPSVLVELGYVSNPEDLAMLRSPDWQKRVAGAIAAAVDAYFAKRAMGAVTAP